MTNDFVPLGNNIIIKSFNLAMNFSLYYTITNRQRETTIHLRIWLPNKSYNKF